MKKSSCGRTAKEWDLSDFLILAELKDFIEQLQQEFSDSTPKAGSVRLLSSTQSLLVHYNWFQLFKLAPKGMGLVISTLFKLQENFVQ